MLHRLLVYLCSIIKIIQNQRGRRQQGPRGAKRALVRRRRHRGRAEPGHQLSRGMLPRFWNGRVYAWWWVTLKIIFNYLFWKIIIKNIFERFLQFHASEAHLKASAQEALQSPLEGETGLQSRSSPRWPFTLTVSLIKNYFKIIFSSPRRRWRWRASRRQLATLGP